MFTDRLAISLTLRIGSSSHDIPGGNLRHVELDLHSYGFAGALEFVLADDRALGGGSEDELLSEFLEPDLIAVDLEIAQVYDHAETAETLPPLAVSGLVTEKSVRETLFGDTPEASVLMRRYRVRFADPAQVLWRQHFPVALYTDSSMADVLAAHVVAPISLRCDWDALDQAAAQVFVHLPGDGPASFYDFVLWYIDSRGGTLVYDYEQQSYAITDDESEGGSTSQAFGDDFAATEMVFAEVARTQPRLHNSYVGDARSELVEQPQAVTGIYRDAVHARSIAQEFDDLVTRESTRTPAVAAEVEFARMPTVDCAPGAILEIAAARRWSSTSSLTGITWRVRELSLRADNVGGDSELDLLDESAGFRIELRARLSQNAQLVPHLPAYRAPHYPGLVEGKVVSESGSDDEITYQVYQNQSTSLDEYKIAIPLWADQQVSAPFLPQNGSSNLYLPAYKDERVLVALELDSARIERLLAWRDVAVLSMDVQGEQMYFGKSATSNTSINHVYEDDAPILNLVRTHDQDTASIQLKEGTLTIRVEERSDG
ncbi:hypothetical protein [Haliangium ochraceum]|uniref:Uncharacterized protein n=1 Tax=Haliangium ochraceum (strain DSM 14365 / JCM 11303 / SMP-2) TaxID=502025 RepID=D0LR46_HALO1|nr:hypothetical protein [Haliangium ochraceum]ACY15554.1 hypothetical protein Hoch_3048 [Haliangium ochraceum DSM 14365]